MMTKIIDDYENDGYFLMMIWWLIIWTCRQRWLLNIDDLMMISLLLYDDLMMTVWWKAIAARAAIY